MHAYAYIHNIKKAYKNSEKTKYIYIHNSILLCLIIKKKRERRKLRATEPK